MDWITQLHPAAQVAAMIVLPICGTFLFLMAVAMIVLGRKEED